MCLNLAQLARDPISSSIMQIDRTIPYLRWGEGPDATEARAARDGFNGESDLAVALMLAILCCCWARSYVTRVPSVSLEGAASTVGGSEIWRVGGGRKVGSKGDARYNNGADAEAVAAVDGRPEGDLQPRELGK